MGISETDAPVPTGGWLETREPGRGSSQNRQSAPSVAVAVLSAVAPVEFHARRTLDLGAVGSGADPAARRETHTGSAEVIARKISHPALDCGRTPGDSADAAVAAERRQCRRH